MKRYRWEIIIVVASSLIIFPFLDSVHLFDWDEINFAEGAREMIVLNNYNRVHINFEPFWEKPPLFIFLQSLSLHVFGISEFSARFINAVLGPITLLIVYKIGSFVKDRSFALIWVIAYLGSILPFFYFNFAIIDPLFNLLIFLCIYFFLRFLWSKKIKADYRLLFLSSLFIALAMLTKGPVAILIFLLLLGIYLLINQFKTSIKLFDLFIFLSTAICINALWLAIEIYQNGTWFIEEFIEYNYRLFKQADAGHGGFPGYHFVVALLGCFPASVFALMNLNLNKAESEKFNHLKQWLIILLALVLVLFTIVQTKIVHYSSLIYFSVTFLAAQNIYYIIHHDLKVPKIYKILFYVTSLTIFSAITTVIFFGLNIDLLQKQISDDFVKANLNAEAGWTGWEYLIPFVFIFVSLIAFRYLFSVKHKLAMILIIFLSGSLMVKFSLIFIAPRIEAYTQNAAVEFFKNLKGKDVYVGTAFYKSYAPLFYSEIQLSNSHKLNFEESMNQNLDKDFYFSVKITKEHQLKNVENIEKLYEKNGFVFYRKKADVGK